MEETETDIEVLLECLKCQRNDAIGLKRTLSTLLSILGSDENTQEYFRESGGLHDVQNLFSQSISTEVQQAAMLCLACAVENNVFSQNALVNAETFSYLHQCLSEKHSRQYIQTASYFLMCLVTNNSVGQNLARESSCLSDALLLFRQCSEVNRMTHDSYEEVLLLWTSLTAALNGCVNNPQNANQRLCSTILPLCFKIIAEENHHELCGPLLLFVGLTVSGNKLNQDRVRQSGGLDTMLNHLQKSLNRLDLGWRDEQHVLLISNALSSSMTDNERNIHFFLEHGGLHVLFSLLESLDMACDGVLGVVIAIGHVLEFAENRFAALTSKEQGKLIKLLTETQSEELVHAIKYVLSQCQELADGAENKEEEQTKIRSKIDELLAKIQHTEEMECLDDGQTLCRKGETAELRQTKDSLSNHLQGPSSNAQGQSVMSRIHQLCNEHGKSLAETLHGQTLNGQLSSTSNRLCLRNALSLTKRKVMPVMSV
ncbi:telomere repeats-binding bouquet formation protein 1-like isoform X2 [Pomacea canaliculata]|uniref:telomere repeats-binding bouquet formation protein 1-like isoform X2 n=1 Tax=Pomacea canaliculata TaxID=400727 RepID=UPI000D739C92|nr:telomere repeats-binding bouquet formation protein 1-like isoform X2 [Pomacea canaliculata]